MTPSAPSIDQLVADLLRATGLLLRRARAEHPHEFSISQFSVMARLAEFGSMTTADLARAEAVKPQSMGATLAPLEQEGLIAREPHPTDRRQMLLRLTPRGEQLRQKNKLATRHWLSDAVGRLSRDERRTLADAAAIISKLTTDSDNP